MKPAKFVGFLLSWVGLVEEASTNSILGRLIKQSSLEACCGVKLIKEFGNVWGNVRRYTGSYDLLKLRWEGQSVWQGKLD
jgi:hypothetical protein